MTLNEQLDQINSAIAAIENGAQEYRLPNRSVRRADLSVLYKERRILQQQAYQENGYNVTVAVFDRR